MCVLSIFLFCIIISYCIVFELVHVAIDAYGDIFFFIYNSLQDENHNGFYEFIDTIVTIPILFENGCKI